MANHSIKILRILLRAFRCVVGVWAIIAVAGCVADLDNDQSPLAPQPRKIPSQPSGVIAERLQIWPVLYPKDTTGDGLGDVIQCMVYLWSTNTRYQYPLFEDSSITFRIYPTGKVGDPEANPIAQWQFDSDEMKTHRTNTVVGNAYYFDLSLSDSTLTIDQLRRLDAVDLVGFYRKQDREAIRSGVSTIHLNSGGG